MTVTVDAPAGWARTQRSLRVVRGTCSNCGRDDDDLSAVHRLYLLPEPSRLDEVEWWCVSCCTQYPHEEAGDQEG
jgi:hypothetical protein